MDHMIALEIDDSMPSYVKASKVRFKIIGRVSIFPHNFTISGEILLIFFIYCRDWGALYFELSAFQNEAKWRLKNENEKYNSYSFASNAHKTHISGISYLRTT